MTENQKLREALQGFLTAMEQGLSLALAAEYARQALALPTAEQVDDINVAESFTSVTKTAPPLVEREVFEEWAKDNAIRTDLGAWDAWQARAGDAMDALKDAFEEGYCARSTYNDVDLSDVETEWAKSSAKAAIDAAMRKGQL